MYRIAEAHGASKLQSPGLLPPASFWSALGAGCEGEVAATTSGLALILLPQIGNRKLENAALTTISGWRGDTGILQKQHATV